MLHALWLVWLYAFAGLASIMVASTIVGQLLLMRKR